VAVGSCLGERYLIVKVPHKAVDADQVRLEVDESLRKLRRSSCELLLLHWPANAIVKGTLSEVWQAMEGLRAAGKCTSLGVCNFNSAALAALLADCEVRPAVNQVERHPLLPQWELLDFCARQRIVVQAHTPLGHGAAAVLRHDVVLRVAREAGLAPAQVLLQWNLRHGVAVVPKCSSLIHANQVLAANPPAATALNAAHMEVIDAIGNGANGGPMGNKRFVNPSFSAHC
jgi:diketogulonate reductase-like aldo/keto reductase